LMFCRSADVNSVVPLTLRLTATIVHYRYFYPCHCTPPTRHLYARNRHLLATSVEWRLHQIAYMIIAAHLIHSKVDLYTQIHTHERELKADKNDP